MRPVGESLPVRNPFVTVRLPVYRDADGGLRLRTDGRLDLPWEGFVVVDQDFLDAWVRAEPDPPQTLRNILRVAYQYRGLAYLSPDARNSPCT